MSKDIYGMYINNENLMKIFSYAKNADAEKQAVIRQKMYNSLKKNYKRLNHMGITQVHFYLPNNRSFLRMYKPEKFGDDVSLIKKSVVLANATYTAQEGFETCNYMAGLRFIYPLFDSNNSHIGSVEISYSTKELLNTITNEFVDDSHILISKSIADGTIVEKELNYNYKESWEAREYYIETYTHKSEGRVNFYDELKTDVLQERIKQGIETKKIFSVISLYNNQNIIMSFLPLFGAEGIKNISYAVTYKKSDYLNELEIEFEYIMALYFVSITMLYFFSLYVVSAQNKLKKLALYDDLTELPNRTLFMIEFGNNVDRAKRYKNKVALLFIDLDGFKNVNDTYGHQVGDELLKKVSKIMLSCIRDSDTVARMGGDEFTIILCDIKRIEDSIEIANNLIESINKEIVINNNNIKIGASIGVSIFPEHSSSLDLLIKYSDEMMYSSKENGKNRVKLYENKGIKNV